MGITKYTQIFCCKYSRKTLTLCKRKEAFRYFIFNIEIINIDGIRWYLATDIAKALGNKNVSMMISNAKVSELEESLLPNLKKGSKQKKCFVSEEGLKKIICKSKKPKASILCQSLWLDIPMYTILK